jgi:hypothetical protein
VPDFLNADNRSKNRAGPPTFSYEKDGFNAEAASGVWMRKNATE